MTYRRKNQVRRSGRWLNLALIRNAGTMAADPNALFLLLTCTLFFGLVWGARFQLSQTDPGHGLKLAVVYQGDTVIGSRLGARGCQFLRNKGFDHIRYDRLLKDVYGFYAHLPEVRTVQYARRQYPDLVEVKVELREPFVRVGGTVFDREGCRLSEAFAAAPAARAVPVLDGLRFPAGLADGDVWANVYFREALRALEAVEGKLAVTGVIVPAVAADTRGITLVTAEGAAVIWGKVFTEGTDPGVSVDRKVRNLDEALKVIGTHMERVDYADISHEKPVITYK
ncbi:MAG: hypothetical protein ABIF71_11570 [Planctomycetota bacterium]